MTVGFHWSLRMSEIDLGQVMINGDAQHGAAFSAFYADRLSAALKALISDFQTQGDRHD